MASVVKRGHELRRAVRQRRRGRWLNVVVMSVNAALFAALITRTPDGLFIAALCATSLALLLGLVSFSPCLELRALRNDVTRPPMTQAQARRWASGALIVAAVAVVVTLLVGALTDAWLIAIGVATPIALLCALLAFFMLRAVPRQGLER